MTDLCWLPSAIMQTTGAIIGIYLFVYFYALGMIRDTVEKIEEKVKTVGVFIPSYKPFFVTLLIGFITIGLNTIWLCKLIHNPDMIFPRMESASIILFFLTLIAIFGLSFFTLKQGYELVKEIKEYFENPETLKDDPKVYGEGCEKDSKSKTSKEDSRAGII